jgi:uncharacterized Zn-binding protein involved in type VI secretion
MFPACRIGDMVRSIWPRIPDGPFYTGSPDTMINGRPAIRIGDNSVPGPAITGSPRTLINGIPAVSIIDQVFCGVIITGSEDTFIN